MKLQQIFNQLSHGELSQYFMGGVDAAGIHDGKFMDIIPHINLALVDLYTRFPLRVDEVVIQQHDQIQVYYLDSKYAETNQASPEPIKYIIDSSFQPFTDNVLKIEKVFNETGQELFLNDRDEYYSVHTPAYNAVQIPYPEKENQLIIEYRAGPVLVPLEEVDPDIYDVALPPTLLEHLLLYIGGRVFSTRDNDEFHTSKNFYKRYEEACLRYETVGINLMDNTLNTKLEKARWV